MWQYTTAFQDNHTRAVILRGGSNYGAWRGAANNSMVVPGSYATNGTYLPRPAGGSHWHFRQAYRLDNYNKYFFRIVRTVGHRRVPLRRRRPRRLRHRRPRLHHRTRLVRLVVDHPAQPRHWD